MDFLTARRSVVRGRVWLPGDPGFDAARRPWNLAIEQPVAAVAEAADADDVAALVRHARAAGLGVAAQPNGHGATGRTDGVILLRTTRLDTLEIDPAARRARVGAGVPSGRLQAAAAPVRRADALDGRARPGRAGGLPADHRHRARGADRLAGPAALPRRRPHGRRRRHPPRWRRRGPRPARCPGAAAPAAVRRPARSPARPTARTAR
ncbi:hypothetical protein GCM10018953_59940 [Streptosporangium nondiastaticum]